MYPPRIQLTITHQIESDGLFYFPLKTTGLYGDASFIISLIPCDSMRLQSSQKCPSVSLCSIIVLVCILISFFLFLRLVHPPLGKPLKDLVCINSEFIFISCKTSRFDWIKRCSSFTNFFFFWFFFFFFLISTPNVINPKLFDNILPAAVVLRSVFP